MTTREEIRSALEAVVGGRVHVGHGGEERVYRIKLDVRAVRYELSIAPDELVTAEAWSRAILEGDVDAPLVAAEEYVEPRWQKSYRWTSRAWQRRARRAA